MSPEEISKIAQIASILEVSGYPKPGNVHRTRDFHDMVFEDFLISGVVIGDSVKEVATQILNLDPTTNKESFLGKYILKAVEETDKWIANNTNLGIIMMLIPIAASGAISDNVTELQENLSLLMENTNPFDAIDLYKAIEIAKAGGMGSRNEFDVTSTNSQEEIVNKNQSMYDVLKISASWDSLANELTSKMMITFNIGFKTFHNFKKTYSINTSTVLTFLTILANVPDTLISRKYGEHKAKEVSKLAKELLNHDNYSSSTFQSKLIEFDDFLFENRLNPGTTADLTAASIMVSYLNDLYDR
ncbi:MAG: triphosphoribosyl-dephospho-CoA synthase [Methanobrevibacter sp.]|nr:triphosphoribosyl-dephospho-CoA synthase [Candidatus Methanovirga aequatorialis]